VTIHSIKINPTGAGIIPAPPSEANMEMANGSGAMEVDVAPGAKPSARAPKPVKRQNEQSSIVFPYMDLDAGVSVALAILGAGGVPLSRDQLAGVMNTNAAGGSFITKIATARIFGLIASAQGKYELTNLGFAITDSDEKRQRAARAEAFLYVELYRRTYEEFKGRQLPPRPNGLEQAFASFGVSPKQTYNARLAFDRSATQAGFFSSGHERLIEPILSAVPTDPVRVSGSHKRLETEPPVKGAAQQLTLEAKPGRFMLEGELDPLIQGLLSRLPKTGDKWETDKRAKWLQTLAANFDMVYQSGDGDNKIIIIECKERRGNND
jgi:hypothetical protein